MPSWKFALPNADQPAWRGGNLVWYASASLATLRALVVARWQLGKLMPRDIAQANARSCANGDQAEQLGAKDSEFVAQIGRIIPRVSRLCPFRSDCLVQALAGQNLLMKRQIASRIVLAAENGLADRFQPHALLMVGKIAVTGGDPEQFTAIFGQSSPNMGDHADNFVNRD